MNPNDANSCHVVIVDIDPNAIYNRECCLLSAQPAPSCVQPVTPNV
jgi:hypothetical protein